MPNQTLTSATAVIDALGGTTATSRLTGRKVAAVSNWRAKGRLPANTFVKMTGELKRRGLRADDCLWGMVEPKVRAA